MSWWKKLLNQQSEMAAEVHNQAIEQPLYPLSSAPAVDITTRLRWLEERVAKLERLIVDMTADS